MMTSSAMIAVVLLLQTGNVGSVPDEIFNTKEKAKLEKADKVEERIRVYQAASSRIQDTLEQAIDKEDYQTIPNNLNLWTTLLSKSLEDIEANLKTKKKSKALKDYEIQVRKSITNLQGFKTNLPVEQQDLLDSCLAQAEKVRKRFVEILFRH